MRFDYTQADVRQLKADLAEKMPELEVTQADYDWELWVHHRAGEWEDHVCVSRPADNKTVGYLMTVDEVAELLKAREAVRACLS